MQVPIRIFYAEVIGRKVIQSNTRTAREALDRWAVPYTTESAADAGKRFWKVDTKHLADAKHSYTLEQAAKEAKKKPKHIPQKEVWPQGPDGMGLMERMANVEQELRTLNAALTGFIKKFEP